MERTCQFSYPRNSANASPPGTFTVYLSWADKALPPNALTSAVTIAIVPMPLLFITGSSFVKASSSAHRFFHERADLCFGGGGQLLQREGDRPHGAFVEVRLVAEAERRVPRLELLRALEEADDLAVLGIRGHPIPESRREGRRAGFDDRLEPLGHGAIRSLHLGDLLEHGAFPGRLVRARAAAPFRLQLSGAFLHRASFLVRESLGLLVDRGSALSGLLRSLLSRFLHGGHTSCGSPPSDGTTRGLRRLVLAPTGDDEGVDGEAAIDAHDHRVRVQGLDVLTEVVGQPRERDHRPGERIDVGRWLPSDPVEPWPDLQSVDETPGARLVERRHRQAPVAQDLDQHTARGDEDQRPQLLVTNDAEVDLDAGGRHRRDGDGRAERRAQLAVSICE